MTSFGNFKIVKGENKWLQVSFAPEIGGRIIQLTLEKHEFLFNNQTEIISEDYKTKAAEGLWINYGGEKLWPAPQGWGKKTYWPGPPDVVLDGGVFTLKQEKERDFYLKSETDAYTGLQVSRTVSIHPSRSFIDIACTFQNKSTDAKEWAIWPVAQLDASNFEENEYELILPLSNNSLHQYGYYIMHGLANNPQIQADGERLTLQFQYLIGKIGSDTAEGWVAYVNKTKGKVYINFFDAHPDLRYPDDSTVQVWTQGRGMIYSRNRIKEFPDDVCKNPPYLEIELLSPLQEIQQQERFSFFYQIAVSTVPKGESIQTVDKNKITATPLKVFEQGNSLIIEGSYGFFEEKRISLKVMDKADHRILYDQEFDVSPLSPLKLWQTVDMGDGYAEQILVQLKSIDENETNIVDQIEICTNLQVK